MFLLGKKETSYHYSAWHVQEQQLPMISSFFLSILRRGTLRHSFSFSLPLSFSLCRAWPPSESYPNPWIQCQASLTPFWFLLRTLFPPSLHSQVPLAVLLHWMQQARFQSLVPLQQRQIPQRWLLHLENVKKHQVTIQNQLLFFRKVDGKKAKLKNTPH